MSCAVCEGAEEVIEIVRDRCEEVLEGRTVHRDGSLRAARHDLFLRFFEFLRGKMVWEEFDAAPITFDFMRSLRGLERREFLKVYHEWLDAKREADKKGLYNLYKKTDAYKQRIKAKNQKYQEYQKMYYRKNRKRILARMKRTGHKTRTHRV